MPLWWLRVKVLAMSGGQVDDLHKARGLELQQPQGALAEGQCGLGTDIHIDMGPEGGHSLQQGDPVKSLDSDAIGPLRGPIRFLLAIPRPHEVFRPVHPGVKDIQGRWPCAGHSTYPPDKASPFTRSHYNSIDIEVLMQPWRFFPGHQLF